MIRFLKNLTHLFRAELASLVNQVSEKRENELKVIGVTGTDGKTTTSHYIYQLLNVTGIKADLIATTGAIIAGKKINIGLHVTTPSPFKIHSLLKRVRQSKAQVLVIEVTSHALDQHRVRGIHFDVGVLTNLGEEHLDYHKTFENYKKAKVKLLKKAEKIVIPKNFYRENEALIGKKNPDNILERGGSILNFKNINIPKNVTAYDRENILSAVGACLHLGLKKNDLETILVKLHNPEGRMDILELKDVRVVIDFAHTKESFKALLPEIKKTTKNKLIHVFGSAGKRDRLKRRKMGKVADKYDDIIILTEEDSRKEKIAKINEEIKKGISKRAISESDLNNASQDVVVEIVNRKDAIHKALAISNPGDTVLLTGKGHEESINRNGNEYPWNEKQVVIDWMKKNED